MAIKQSLATATLNSTNHIFQASENSAVTSIHLCDISSSDATVNIYLLPTDGSTTVPTENNKLYNGLTLKATDTYVIDTEKMILSNGDKIFIEFPDSTGQVIATISTIGL